MLNRQPLASCSRQGLRSDEEIAGILVAEGFSTVEEIAYVPAWLTAGVVEGFDEDIVEEPGAQHVTHC